MRRAQTIRSVPLAEALRLDKRNASADDGIKAVAAQKIKSSLSVTKYDSVSSQGSQFETEWELRKRDQLAERNSFSRVLCFRRSSEFLRSLGIAEGTSPFI